MKATVRYFLALMLILLSDSAAGLQAQDAPHPSAPPGGEIAEPSARPSPVKTIPAGVTAPRLIHRVSPEYSDKARRKGISGRVEISFMVSEQGVPYDLHVTQSPGYDLDKQAVAAVSQYRFAPAIKDGKPVACPLTISVDFAINKWR